MIEEPGKIVALNDRYVWIETIRLSACHACSAKAGCGQAVMGQLLDETRQSQKNLVKLDRDASQSASTAGSLKLGQSVLLGIPEDALIKASLLAYGVPVAALIAGAAFGLWIGLSEPLIALTGLTAQVASLMWVRRLSADWACQYRFKPNLLKPALVDAK